ncbi:MAG: hypothetical protein HN849_07140 [Victivallales bacterium]|nr:hypothetical protein [Victivallales bacterium]
MKMLKTILILAVVAGLVFLGVHFGGQHFGGGGGGPALASSLPADTQAWVSIQDVDSLATGLGGKESMEELFDLFGEQPDFVAFLDKYMGEKANDKTAGKLFKWLAAVKSADLVFQGVGIHAGQPVPELVLMLDLPSQEATSKAMKKLGKVFSEKSKHKGAAVQELTKKLAEEMDGVTPCIAKFKTRLLFSMDRKTLEGGLDMLRDGSKESLAKSKAYRRLTKDTGTFGTCAWLGSSLLDEVLDLVPKDEQTEARKALSASGLDQAEGLWMAGDAAKGKTLLRLGLKKAGKLAKTFSLAATDRSFATIAPDDSWVVASISIEDGAALWGRLDTYLSEVAQTTGGARGQNQYRQGIDGMEQNLGVGPKDVFAILADLGVCVGGKANRPTFAVLARVTDKGKAKGILEGLAKKMGAPSQPTTVKGKTIETLGGFVSYAMIDDVICFGVGGPDGVKKVVESQAAGKVVGKTAGYKSVAKRLPEKTAVRLYYNIGSQLVAMGKQAGPMAELLKKKKAAREAMVMGLAVHAENGIFEATLATPPAEVVSELYPGGMVDALRKARGKARLVSDLGNLKQLSLGMIMFADDNNGSFPKDLGAIWTYVGSSGAVFRCPASRRPPPKSAGAVARGDCDYIYLKPAVNLNRIRSSSQEPIMITRPGLLMDNMVNVAYADGHVTSHSVKALAPRVRASLEKHHGRGWLRKLKAKK